MPWKRESKTITPLALIVQRFRTLLKRYLLNVPWSTLTHTHGWCPSVSGAGRRDEDPLLGSPPSLVTVLAPQS